MDCCQCQGIENKFDQKYVTRKLEKYRKDGPKKTTRLLIGALKSEDISGLTLLDIGGGLGDIQHDLLRSGVSYAQNVEASMAYLDASKSEAENQGHADMVDYIHGNFVDVADDIDPADVVTLDRVICCYNDMLKLVNLSSQKAKRLYGIVYPRDTWWVRLGMHLYYNSRNWLQRNPMRYYVHPKEAVEAAVQGNGLERRFHRESGPWQVVLFYRS